MAGVFCVSAPFEAVSIRQVGRVIRDAPTPAIDSLLNDALTGRRVGDVGQDDERLTIFALDHVEGFVDPLLIRVDECDAGAFSGEQDSGGSAVTDSAGDAGASTRHDGDLACEAFT